VCENVCVCVCVCVRMCVCVCEEDGDQTAYIDMELGFDVRLKL